MPSGSAIKMSRLQGQGTRGGMLSIQEKLPRGQRREESDESNVYHGTVEMSGGNDRAYLETVDMHDTDPWTITLKVRQVCIRFKIYTRG